MGAEVAQSTALQIRDRVGRGGLSASAGSAAVEAEPVFINIPVDALHVDRDLVAAFDLCVVIVVIGKVKELVHDQNLLFAAWSIPSQMTGRQQLQKEYMFSPLVPTSPGAVIDYPVVKFSLHLYFHLKVNGICIPDRKRAFYQAG